MAAHLHAPPSTLCLAPRRARPFRMFAGLFGLWRQRRSLAQLDAHLLEDLGLTRAEAEREARRALWDVPRSWRR